MSEPRLVADINSTSFGSNPTSFVRSGGSLYFIANDDVGGSELWRADPATGSVSRLEINPGSSGSNIGELIDVNGTLYFSAYHPSTGYELYRISSSSASPELIELVSGGGSSSPSSLTNVNGTLYFRLTQTPQATSCGAYHQAVSPR